VRPGRMIGRLFGRNALELPKVDARGKVAVVTGASGGIGLETALGLARVGFEVHLVGRSPERTEAAHALVSEISGQPAAFYLADFSSLDAVRRLGDTLAAATPKLHLLVNNAGLWHPKKKVSQDGLDDTIAVNHLAPFVLTMRLLDALRAAAPARVVHVSSRLHRSAGAFDFEDPQWERKRYRGLGAYSQSKLANVLFSNELARRLAPDGVSSNSLHPGDVATDVTRDSKLLQFGSRVAGRLLLTPKEGAATSLIVATSPELEGVSGCYFADGKQEEPSRHALNEADAARLWSWSAAVAAG
jgi:NAD(P)-dependent dehydrogenase (short-subunit alcohol dehydrogenase family)